MMEFCLRLANNPGWKAYIWNEVKEFDKHEPGFRDDFLSRISKEKNQ
jgi:hypothetical protein